MLRQAAVRGHDDGAAGGEEAFGLALGEVGLVVGTEVAGLLAHIILVRDAQWTREGD